MDPNAFNMVQIGGQITQAPLCSQYRGREKWSFFLEHQRRHSGGMETWSILVDVWFDRLYPTVQRLAVGDHVLVIGDLRPMGGQQIPRKVVLKINADKIFADTGEHPAGRIARCDPLPEAAASQGDSTDGGPI
jgi:hypothetical protein